MIMLARARGGYEADGGCVACEKGLTFNRREGKGY